MSWTPPARENVVAARLGRGWFAGDVGQFGAEQYGDFPALLAQLEIDVAGGRRIVVATDASWRAHPGPLVADDLLMGEHVDARDEPTGWDEPGFRDDDWRPVIVRAGPGGRLVAQRDAGVGIVDELEPRAITNVEPGRQIVDFGQNLAGHVRIQATQPAGTTIVVRHGEALDPDGGLYTANLRKARQTDTYTFRGDGPEVFEPRFTYHGFRYAEISWPLGGTRAGPADRARGELRGATIGSFACSDELVNAVHRNVVWGLRGGLVGIPTDCPQRDERLGWTADAAAMAPSALFLGDTAPVFEKWLTDLADAQLPSGAYPDIAPRIGVTGGGNAGWADAGVQVPWLIYQRTGNAAVVERQYDSMLRYLRFLEADHVGGVRHGGRYGDWLALEDPTSLELIGTAYLAHSAALFVRMARLLGRDRDADDIARLAVRARAAFRRGFTTAPGVLGRETQTGYALALGFDLLPPRARPTAADRLARPHRGCRRPPADRVPGYRAGPARSVRQRPSRTGHATRPPGHVPELGLRGPPGRDDDLGALELLDPRGRVRGPGDELAQPRGAGLRRRLAPRVPRGARPGRARLSDDARAPAAGGRDRVGARFARVAPRQPLGRVEGGPRAPRSHGRRAAEHLRRGGRPGRRARRCRWTAVARERVTGRRSHRVVRARSAA